MLKLTGNLTAPGKCFAASVTRPLEQWMEKRCKKRYYQPQIGVVFCARDVERQLVGAAASKRVHTIILTSRASANSVNGKVNREKRKTNQVYFWKLRLSSLPKLKKFRSFEAEVTKKVCPIVAVKNHGNGVLEIKRECLLQSSPFGDNGRKGRKIKMLTNKSLQKLIATVQATDIEFYTMLTLTYPKIFPNNGQEVKADLNGMLSYLRSKWEFEYLWFIEFQKRGAPHFHILTDHRSITPSMRLGLAEVWVKKIINSDWFIAQTVIESVNCDKCEYDVMTRHVKNAFAVVLHRDTWQFVRDLDGAKKYVTKYASKPEQKEVPKNYRDVGRFWGCSKGVRLGDGVQKKTTEKQLQRFLFEQDHPTAKFDMLPKFVYGVKHTD